MPIQSPDLFSVLSMMSLSCFLMAWMLWLIGRPYWQQGLAWVALSSLLYGSAFALFLVHHQTPHAAFDLSSKLLICLALALLVVSLQRFRQYRNHIRDLLIIAIPIFMTLFVLLMPHPIPMLNALFTLLYAVMSIYSLGILMRMRSRTPGNGWRLLMVASSIQLMLILWLFVAQTDVMSALLLPDEITMLRLACLMVFITLFLNSFGFLIMTHDRRNALEQGQEKLDYLTHLPDPTTLAERLRHIVQQDSTTTTPLSIMLINIDYFDRINAQHGHLVGDQVIQMVASLLQSHCRATDIASRYNVQEFAVLLSNTTIQGAETLAKRLAELVRTNTMMTHNHHPLTVTISIGVHCCIPEKNHKWEILLSSAQTALQKAKSNGHDNVVILTPSMLQNIH